MKRRRFLKNTSAIVVSSIVAHYNAVKKSTGMDQLGIQLFSLPLLLEQDFRGAISMLAQMGYTEMELYGPFPFSAESTKASWDALAPRLGFNGSGYFGHSPEEVRAIFDENNIQATSTHTDLETLQTNMGRLGEAADVLGLEFAGIPMIPEEKRKTLDGYKRMAEEFNKIGEAAQKVGLKFAYHNHGYGLQEMEGEIPVQLLLDQTDPDLVFFEMDIYWTTAGGADPIDYLEAYPNRYHLMHLKDMKEKVRFSGDGGDPSQWMELFPHMATAGEGILDLKSIVAAAEEVGVKRFYVEQDMVAQPEIALGKSYNYLTAQ